MIWGETLADFECWNEKLRLISAFSFHGNCSSLEVTIDCWFVNPKDGFLFSSELFSLHHFSPFTLPFLNSQGPCLL